MRMESLRPPDPLRRTFAVERLAIYRRVRGLFVVLAAFAIYWLALGVLGFFVSIRLWCAIAVAGTGLLVPLAAGLARWFGRSAARDRNAGGDVIVPALVAMMLCWPLALATLTHAPLLLPLVLATALSLHWPVLGWSMARPVLFSAHAVAVVLIAFATWLLVPQGSFTLLPLVVALAHVITAGLVFADSARRVQS